MLLLRLSGIQPALAQAEAEALLATVDARALSTGRPQLVATEAATTEGTRTLLERLALTHEVLALITPPAGQPLDSIAVGAKEFSAAVAAVAPAARTFCCRVEGLAIPGGGERGSGHAGHPKRVRGASALERELGARLVGALRVDLTRPDVLVRGFLDDGRAWVGIQWLTHDPAAFEARAVKHRPFFSPVSLHPRLARALVNLAGLSPGDLLADPFCGTGGILLEGALTGLRVSGSDVDPRMVEGSRDTLGHYGQTAERLVAADIGSSAEALGVERFDAVVTDLPYGRSASTRREGAAGVRARAMPALAELVRPGGRIVAGTDDRLPPPPSPLVELAVFPLRVHRSLTRHFHLYEKQGS